MKKIVIIIVLLMVSPFTFAQNSQEDLKFVEKLIQDKITIIFDDLLRNKSLDQEVRNQKVIDELIPLFDFSLMSRLSLGKAYKKLSKAKREEFKKAFIKSSQEFLISKLNLFTDETVEFKKAFFAKKRIHVETVLISNNDKYDITYKLYKSKQGWKVYDAQFLGVSLMQSYRTQFSSVLKSGGIDDLIAKLNKAGGIAVTK